MFKIYNLMLRLRQWLTATVCPADELADLTARDLADLPAYHPRRDDDGGCAA